MAASTAVTLEEDASPAERTAVVAALTGLRGSAALMVLLVNVAVLSPYPWLGVVGFGPVSLFTLSGFLLFRPWARWGVGVGDRPSTVAFVRHRVARIFPAYLVVLLAVVAVYAPTRPTTGRDWLSLVMLTWMYDDRYLPAVLLQTWSLSTELSWYVALPVMGGIAVALARRARSPRASFWVIALLLATSLPVSVAWRTWVSTQTGDTTPYVLWLPGFLVCFASGALVAHLLEGYRAGIVRLTWLRRLVEDPWPVLLLVLGLALISTSALGGPPGLFGTNGEEQVRIATASVMALLLLAGAALGAPDTPLNRALGSRAVTAVGRWSYGIFLWHLPVLIVLDDKIDVPGGLLGLVVPLVVVLAVSVPLAAATYAWVERPAAAWSHRTVQRERRRDDSSDETAPAATSSTTSPHTDTPARDHSRNDEAGS